MQVMPTHNMRLLEPQQLLNAPRKKRSNQYELINALERLPGEDRKPSAFPASPRRPIPNVQSDIQG